MASEDYSKEFVDELHEKIYELDHRNYELQQTIKKLEDERQFLMEQVVKLTEPMRKSNDQENS